MQASDVQGQNVLDCLTVLPAVVPSIHPSLRHRIAPLFATLATAARSKFPVVRQSVSRCYASLCEVMPSEGLMQVVRDVVPILGDPLNSDHRRGAIEVISRQYYLSPRALNITGLLTRDGGADIVQRLDIQILPYVIFLVVPVLGRMSDSDDDVRLMATNTFASLIKLVPLEVSHF
jgi:TATA-binding protein-associated factor